MRQFKNILKVCLIVFSLFTSCTSHTTTTVDTQNVMLPNGKRIVIEKTNTKTAQYGIITKLHYRDHYSYTYNCTLKEGDIYWNGGSREPKEILFTQDTIYLKSLTKQPISYQAKDVIHNTSEVLPHYEVQEVVEKFVDKRYFFKWFGEAYWLTVPKEIYTEKVKEGNSYMIPNDNELTLKLL